MTNERLEALMRIVVAIVSGIILGIWRYFVAAISFINFLVIFVTGKRMKQLAGMGELWNSQWYTFQRYMIFQSNARPFPFSDLKGRMSKFEK